MTFKDSLKALHNSILLLLGVSSMRQGYDKMERGLKDLERRKDEKLAEFEKKRKQQIMEFFKETTTMRQEILKRYAMQEKELRRLTAAEAETSQLQNVNVVQKQLAELAKVEGKNGEDSNNAIPFNVLYRRASNKQTQPYLRGNGPSDSVFVLSNAAKTQPDSKQPITKIAGRYKCASHECNRTVHLSEDGFVTTAADYKNLTDVKQHDTSCRKTWKRKRDSFLPDSKAIQVRYDGPIEIV